MSESPAINYIIVDQPEDEGFGRYLIRTLQGLIVFTALNPGAAIQAAKEFDKRYIELLQQFLAAPLKIVDGYWNGYAIFERGQGESYQLYVIGDDNKRHIAEDQDDAYRIIGRLANIDFFPSAEDGEELEIDDTSVKPGGEP